MRLSLTDALYYFTVGFTAGVGILCLAALIFA